MVLATICARAEEDLKRRIKQMTPEQRQERFTELNEKLDLTSPTMLAGADPAIQSATEMLEREILKELLGYK